MTETLGLGAAFAIGMVALASLIGSLDGQFDSAGTSVSTAITGANTQLDAAVNPVP